MDSTAQNSLRIWNLSDSPNGDRNSYTILWNSFSVGDCQLSVPAYLETHSERLRKKYLKFVFDLSQSKINGKSIVQHFALKDGYSFWWMNKIAEKSPFKSPKIYDCLKMFALEEILTGSDIKSIVLMSSNKDLASSIHYLCQGLNINFKWTRLFVNKQFTFRSLYEILPYALQAMVSLRHIFYRLRLSNKLRPKWFSGSSSILMCSYFFNLDNKGHEGCFYSNQWGNLSGHLKKLGYKLNWIQHYLPSPDIPNVNVAASKIGNYNQSSSNNEIHSFLDGYLSTPLILKVIGRWFSSNLLRWSRLDVSKNFKVESSHVWLWPLLRHDWNSSVLGVDSVTNWFWVELFDEALKDMPKQKIGIYLWENQGWEAALLKAWRKYQHGKVIGVPHTTICYWHLNNFEDSECFMQTGDFSKPFPDYLAVNGSVAWHQFALTGYPLSKMRKVEAVRFHYLARQNKNALTKKETLIPPNEVIKRILLLGDFTLYRTIKMLDCVRGLSAFPGYKIQLTIKPHPVCDFNQKIYPQISFEVTNEPIQNIMNRFDAAFASNTTSAALDAFLFGLPVAVYVDGDDFNHSPLKNISNTSFVANSKELKTFLYTDVAQNEAPSPDDFFWFDDNLERWTTLISEAKNQ